MTALVWDNVGDRVFQTGVSQGVLYLSDSSGVAWNGLISITEISNLDSKIYHTDSVKYLEQVIPGDFAAELRAFTYPEEFETIVGVLFDDDLDLFFHDQPTQSFGLCYRTTIGDDVSGVDRGYRLHIVYNLRAVTSNTTYTTQNSQINPTEFVWNLSATPIVISGHRPTAHVSIDSTKIHPDKLQALELILYGSEDTDPTLPSLPSLIAFLGGLALITIIDHGDGTWSAIGPDALITMLDSDTFQITEANATYLDADTYNISSTDF